MSVAIVKCAVIGAGTMGSGIAFVAATAGIEAFQVDVKQEQLDRAGHITKKPRKGPWKRSACHKRTRMRRWRKFTM